MLKVVGLKKSVGSQVKHQHFGGLRVSDLVKRLSSSREGSVDFSARQYAVRAGRTAMQAAIPSLKAVHARLGQLCIVPVRRSIISQLAQSASPVFNVVGLHKLAVFDGVDVDGHDLEAFAAGRHAKERPHRCA